MPIPVTFTPPLGVALSTSPAEGLAIAATSDERVALSASVTAAVGSLIETGPVLFQVGALKSLPPVPGPFKSVTGACESTLTSDVATLLASNPSSLACTLIVTVRWVNVVVLNWIDESTC